MPAKFEAALQLAKKLLYEGKKVILWSVFVHNLTMIENSLSGINYYKIDGSIPKDDSEDLDNRERRIKEFKKTSEPSLLIANPAACAESISLHEACHDAIYLERSFNCGQFIQSMDRIDRISQNPKQANYYILIAKNTIDQTIDTQLEVKYSSMIHVLEDDIPEGDFELFEPELEPDKEIDADFEATVKDVKKFIKAQKVGQ